MIQTAFQETVKDYYRNNGRDLPWRHTADQYAILVSEIMLQQTQVSRVIPKYQAFLGRFPTIGSLAAANLGEVLKVWSGLGYNRRAKYLHEAAKTLVSKDTPWKFEDLVACKGIGANTAAAVMVYAYNQPRVFIETNIRTVYLHHFFAGKTAVSDKLLLPLIERSLDTAKPREWYWALMDYGTYLKSNVGNAARRSQHYTKQSVFQGSRRQVRGQILRLLTQAPRSAAELTKTVADRRLVDVLYDLKQEGFIQQTGDSYRLW